MDVGADQRPHLLPVGMQLVDGDTDEGYSGHHQSDGSEHERQRTTSGKQTGYKYADGGYQYGADDDRKNLGDILVLLQPGDGVLDGGNNLVENGDQLLAEGLQQVLAVGLHLGQLAAHGPSSCRRLATEPLGQCADDLPAGRLGGGQLLLR